MNSYLHVNRMRWRSRLAQYSKFLLSWGWFIILSIIVTTVTSSRIADSPSTVSYQATLQAQVQLPSALNGPVDSANSTLFFERIFLSPSSLNLAVTEHPDLQLRLQDIQSLVTAQAVSGTDIIQLTAFGVTPDYASKLVMDVYRSSLQVLHQKHSEVITALEADLHSELAQCQADIQQSAAQLQSLIQTHSQTSSQYRQVDLLYRQQQDRARVINNILADLDTQNVGNSDLIALRKTTPDITTVPSSGQTQSLRLALSPLIGLIMGLGGALLANHFSNRVPLHGKKREMVLSHIGAIIPVLPKLRNDSLRLQVLRDTSSVSLTLLRRLRYKTSEHEKRLQLITLISPERQEGKSTIATSLAIASAQSGLHTLLIDANPLRPVLHKWFGLQPTVGTLDVIRSLATGSVGPSPILSTSIAKLSLLPIGNVNKKDVSNTIEEALRIDGLGPLIALTRKQADYIIFDGPPLLSNAGAINLLTLSDAALLVVDAQRSRSTKVMQAEALLSEIGIPYVIVLNRANQASVE